MFREKYKKENEIIEPNAEVINDLSAKIKNTIAENTPSRQRHFPLKTAVAFMLVAVITAAGMSNLNLFGRNPASEPSDNPEATVSDGYKNHPFTLVAYAAENTDASYKEKIATEIKPAMKVKIPKIKIESGTASSNGANYIVMQCDDLTSAFFCQGEGVKSVKYTSQTGSISNNFSNFAHNSRNSELLKVCTVKSDEEIFWIPTGTFEDLMSHPEKKQNYSLLKGDVITIAATYENGEVQTKKLNLSFDKDGNLFAELEK